MLDDYSMLVEIAENPSDSIRLNPLQSRIMCKFAYGSYHCVLCNAQSPISLCSYILPLYVMRVTTICAVALAALATAMLGTSASAASSASWVDSSNIDAEFASLYPHSQFHAFKAAHGKTYASAELEAHRFAIFADNVRHIAAMNEQNPTAHFAVNQFADMHPGQ